VALAVAVAVAEVDEAVDGGGVNVGDPERSTVSRNTTSFWEHRNWRTGNRGWGSTAKPKERSRGRSSRIRTVASNARDNLRYIGADTIEIFVLPGTKFVDAGCCAGRVARWHGGLGMDCRCEEKQQGEHCEEWGRGHSVC